MAVMYRIAVLLALIVSLPLRAADALDRFVEVQMARQRIPGLAVAVVRDGRIEALRAWGFASLEQRAPVTTDSAFQAASATKIFTAILLMDFVREGKLALGAPVTESLPDAPESWKAITIRHLASHTSGMQPNRSGDKPKTMQEALASAYRLPLVAAPGETVAYGSDDFTVLQAILEKVGGKPFDALLRDRILGRLSLADTRFENAGEDGFPSVVAADVVPRRVTTYRRSGDRQQMYWFVYPVHTYAAGGIFTSARDFARLLLAIDRGEILSRELLEQMWVPAALRDGRKGDFATGWVVSAYRGRRMVGHSGGPALADVVYFPEERLGVVVLQNQRTVFPNLAQEIAGLYLAPASFPDRGVADANPDLTKRIHAALDELHAGRVPAAFTGVAREAATGGESAWLFGRIGVYPPIERMTLLEDGGGARVYRVAYANGTTLRWKFVISASGAIEDFDIFGE